VPRSVFREDFSKFAAKLKTNRRANYILSNFGPHRGHRPAGDCAAAREQSGLRIQGGHAVEVRAAHCAVQLPREQVGRRNQSGVGQRQPRIPAVFQLRCERWRHADCALSQRLHERQVQRRLAPHLEPHRERLAARLCRRRAEPRRHDGPAQPRHAVHPPN